MKRKLIVIITLLALTLSMIPLTAMADYTPPKVFGGPEDFSVHPREDGFEKTWEGFDATVSASDDLRAFVDVVGADNSPFSAAGYYFSGMMLQVDFKIDNGDWHYKSQWDQDFGYNSNKSIVHIEKGTYSNGTIFEKFQFEEITQGETLPKDLSFFDTHAMDFRTRFLITYQDNLGQSYSYYSPWSKTVTFSNNQKAEDPDKLINHTPVLRTAELKKSWSGSPYFTIISEKAHEDLRTLNSISDNSVKTEVWLKVGSNEWKLCYTGNFEELFDVAGMEAYFGLKETMMQRYIR